MPADSKRLPIVQSKILAQINQSGDSVMAAQKASKMAISCSLDSTLSKAIIIIIII